MNVYVENYLGAKNDLVGLYSKGDLLTTADLKELGIHAKTLQLKPTKIEYFKLKVAYNGKIKSISAPKYYYDYDLIVKAIDLYIKLRIENQTISLKKQIVKEKAKLENALKTIEINEKVIRLLQEQLNEIESGLN